MNGPYFTISPQLATSLMGISEAEFVEQWLPKIRAVLRDDSEDGE